MTFEEKVEYLRRGYDAALRLDLDAYLALQHPEVETHDATRPDPHDPAGIYRGRDGLKRYWEDWIEAFEEFRTDPEEFIDADPGVVVRVRASGRARASGVEVENVRFHAYTFREGQIGAWGVYAEEDEAVAAARS